MSKNDWARAGMFQKPRLRINDKLDPNPGGLSSTEQFFNVCFCTAYGVGKVGKYLVKDQSIVNFLAYFFAWWSAWIMGSEYACRYNNIDFTHKIFWTVYGGGVALMLEHTGGGMDGINADWFCYSCAMVACFVGLMTFRVSFHIAEARFSALWHGTFMMIISFFWIMAGFLPNYRGVFWALAIVFERLNSGAFLLLYTPHIVPISKPYTINKFSIICVLSLGAFVAAAVGNVDPGSWPEQSRMPVRGTSMLAFAIFINFKFLVVDVDPISLESHAIARSIIYRVAWSQFQPFLIISMVAASAGLDSLLTEQLITSSVISTNDERDAADLSNIRMTFGRKNAYFSTAAFFVALVIQRLVLNLPPPHLNDHRKLRIERALGNLLQVLVAGLLVAYPILTPVSTWPLNLGDMIVLSIAASGLVVMHLVIKQRELLTLDESHETLPITSKKQKMITSSSLKESNKTNEMKQNINKKKTIRNKTNKYRQHKGEISDPSELEALKRIDSGSNWEGACNITNFDEEDEDNGGTSPV